MFVSIFVRIMQFLIKAGLNQQSESEEPPTVYDSNNIELNDSHYLDRVHVRAQFLP